LFAEYGLPVSLGYAVDTPKEAAEACDKIGGTAWVVKAQVHAGGRGKAGGVKLVRSKEEAKAFAQQWLDQRLVTYQTDANGQPVSKILVESCTDIAKELYLGAVVDRSTRRIVFMASTEGGVDIEKVAHETPEKILKTTIDPLVGAQPFQGRELAFKLGLKGDQIKQFAQIFVGLAKLFQVRRRSPRPAAARPAAARHDAVRHDATRSAPALATSYCLCRPGRTRTGPRPPVPDIRALSKKVKTSIKSY
jgi:succinyl-CoA synthetase beta subunit